MGSSNTKEKSLDSVAENRDTLLEEAALNWENLFAEIIHHVNDRKIWPRRLSKGAIVFASRYTTQCSWTVWRSDDHQYIFGIKIRHKEKCEYHYLKPTKKWRKRTEIRLLKGKLPTAKSSPTADKRAFFVKRPEQDSTKELLCHVKTGRYLTSDDATGKLKLTGKSVRANGWFILEQIQPTEDV